MGPRCIAKSAPGAAPHLHNELVDFALKHKRGLRGGRESAIRGLWVGGGRYLCAGPAAQERHPAERGAGRAGRAHGRTESLDWRSSMAAAAEARGAARGARAGANL